MLGWFEVLVPVPCKTTMPDSRAVCKDKLRLVSSKMKKPK